MTALGHNQPYQIVDSTLFSSETKDILVDMELLRILSLPLTLLLVGWGFLGCVGHLLDSNPIEFFKIFLIIAVPAVFMTSAWFKESKNHAADLIIAFSLLGLVYGFFEDPSLIIIVASGAPAALIVLLAIFSKSSHQTVS